MNSRPQASLSLDLDNRWSYMKTHGDAGWEEYPSYLDTVVPRFLDVLEARNLKITVFVVGQDVVFERNHAAIKSIVERGHELGNHSFSHEPWLHRYSDEQIVEELRSTHDLLKDLTGHECRGFRGPGYSLSDSVLRTIVDMGYEYDASSFPTVIGPLARAYYFMTSKLDAEKKEEREQLFGSWKDGFGTLKPHMRQIDNDEILEIPVTTMPIFKVPFHLSYLLYLRSYSAGLSRTYLRFALLMCRLTDTRPSFLLHPLDFLGCDDGVGLDFFPAMNLKAAQKLELINDVLDIFGKHYAFGPMSAHADLARQTLATRIPAAE